MLAPQAEAEAARAAAPLAPVPPPHAVPANKEFFAPVPGPGRDLKPVSLAAQIDRLTATGRPEDAQRAFKIALDCKEGRDDQRKGDPTATPAFLSIACGDITNLQMREMGKNLDKAVAARIPDALFAKLQFGPLGGNPQALIDMPNDPSVMEWKKNIVADVTDAAWDSGDFLLLAALSRIHSEGVIAQKNPQLALGYYLAMFDITFTNGGTPGQFREGRAKELAKRSVGMSPEQIAEAEALAKKIALNCCSKK